MSGYKRFSFTDNEPPEPPEIHWLFQVASVVLIAVVGAVLHGLGLI